MGNENACDVCGGSETKLVDGFYYCAECGTQDTNVRETVVDHTALIDGTFGFVSKLKYSVKIKDGVQMSPEWYKWHAYNFIVAGMTEELVRLGAAPSVKMKVLWIWAKYIKKYQNKEQMFDNIMSEIKDQTEDTERGDNEQEAQKKVELDMTQNILVTILNLALNLDKSKLQLSHLRRFILNGHLGIDRCREYVPKEINTNAIRGWTCTLKKSNCRRFTRVRLAPAMKKCMALDLGPYLIPNIESMVNNHLKELCLPNDLKHLVLSLMVYAPVDYLNGGKKSHTLPDFEGLVMSYVLVGLKMCFGLDDDYEQRLSEAVEIMNDEENRLKAYKMDMFQASTDRLFSFREWCNYLLFRKYMHCNYNSSMAKERRMFLDDYVFMEHSKPETKEVLLSEEVTMDIINKIPQQIDFDVIPVSKFEPSMTPLSTLTEVICQHLQDLDARRTLSEDFTQYSINYACRDLALTASNSKTFENIIVGVSESRKTYNELLGLHFTSSYSDSTMVYVRNCENKNWFNTKRPTTDHIVKVKESSDKDSDLGYDSNLENTPVESNTNERQEKTTQNGIHTESTSTNSDANTSVDDDDEDIKKSEKRLEVFEEDESGNIFDDDFLDVNKETKFIDTIQNLDSTFNDTMGTVNIEDSIRENNLEDSIGSLQSISLIDDVEPKLLFDPTTFDRESTIKELVIAACYEYKVRLPYKYRMQEAKKRKSHNMEVSEPKSKRARIRPDVAKIIEKNEKQAEVQEIITSYYHSLEQDILHEVSQHVKSFVDNMAEQNITNDSIDQNEVGNENNDNDLDQSDNQIIMEHSEIDEESDDGSIQDPVYKGDPEFDEKTHDTKQLYLKIKGEFETRDLFDLDSDEEINKLLEEQIKNPCKPLDDDSGDDSGNLPFSRLCKPKKPRKDKLQKLIPNPESIGTFSYWCKHYISRTFKKHELTERFDAEIRNTFPKSFGFVLFECAAVLDCSAYSLYRHMTDIEEEMLKKAGFVRKMASLKDTGIRIERRDYETRKKSERKRRTSSGKQKNSV